MNIAEYPFTEQEIEERAKQIQRAEWRANYQKNKEKLKQQRLDRAKKKAINALMYEHMQTMRAEEQTED